MSKDKYAKFDAVVTDLCKTAVKDETDSISRLVTAIGALPQAEMIPDERREAWLSNTIKMAKRRMEIEGKSDLQSLHDHILWHIRRASGIGGSDVGVIVLGARGKPGSFSTARDVAAQKLLMVSPDAGTIHTSRGIRGEEWVQRMLLEETGASSITEDLQKLRDFRIPDAPYCIGTPDDFLKTDGNLPGFKGVKRMMVDYKCPSEDVYKEMVKDGIPIEYACQLSHYERIARSAGVEFEAVALAPFNSQAFRVELMRCDPDPDLNSEIEEALHDFWENHVMKDVLPDDLSAGIIEGSNPEVRNLAAQSAMLKIISDSLTKEQKDISERISAIEEDRIGLATGSIDLGVWKISRTRKWDEEVLIKLAEEAGLDLNDFQTSTGKIDKDSCEEIVRDIYEARRDRDKDALLAAIKKAEGGLPEVHKLDADALALAISDKGLSTIPAQGVQERSSLSRKKDDAEKIITLKEQGEEVSEAVLQAVMGISPEIADGSFFRDPDDAPEEVVGMSA